MNPTSHQVAHVRDFESYSENVKFVLNILSINEVPRVVGSAKYLEHRYPGDIDAMEVVTVNGNREEALDFYTNQLQSVAQELNIASHNLYLSDFKAGLDTRFDSDITKDTTKCEMKKIIGDLYYEGLIYNDEVEDMYNAMDKWEDFKEILRRLKTVRWELDEVIMGEKVLRKNKLIKFRDAIAMDTVVKIDVISWLEERFISVEMFYLLQYKYDGVINTFFEQGNYYKGLVGEVQKYANPDNYNPLKLVKRLWNLSTLVDCTKTLEDIIPLLQSDAAALNQIKSDAEVLIDLLDKFNNVPIGKVFLEVIHFRKRAGNHLTLKQYDEYKELMDCTYHQYLNWQYTGYFDRELLIEKLVNLKKWLEPIIFSKSDAFVRRMQQEPMFCEPIAFFKDQPLPPEATQYVEGMILSS